MAPKNGLYWREILMQFLEINPNNKYLSTGTTNLLLFFTLPCCRLLYHEFEKQFEKGPGRKSLDYEHLNGIG